MTAILTQRCDPFGMETGKWGEQLLGGVMNAAGPGKYKWYCKEPAAGRYRMRCTGGDYGFRIQPDGGLIKATHCDGGHQGQIMTLCTVHVTEFSVGPPKPGFTKDLRTPVGQVGGTVANELCPRCAYPPEARTLTELADFLHAEISRLRLYPFMTGDMLTAMQALEQRQETTRTRLDELHQDGRIHKCPLRLVEVS